MLELKASSRQELGKKTNKQRKAGQIPAVIYGHGIKSEPLYVASADFIKILKKRGRQALLPWRLAAKKEMF